MNGEAPLDSDWFDLLQTFYEEESCLELLNHSSPFVTQRLSTTGSPEMSEIRQNEQVSPRFQVFPGTSWGSAMAVQVQNYLNAVSISFPLGLSRLIVPFYLQFLDPSIWAPFRLNSLGHIAQNNTERGAGIVSLPLFNISAIIPSNQERPRLQSFCHA